MNNRVAEKKGSIVCVGIGMTLGSHLSPLSRSYIIEADIVFVLVSDGIVEKWITEMNKSVKSLQVYYHEGSSRGKSYQLMVDDIYSHVQNGEKVVGAFYGHPGVFACVPHMVIELARNNGFYAKMEPGISAEDCLYADVGIDPGEFGCTHFEASQFMFFERKVDNSAYLILWQVAIVGDTSLTQFSTGKQYRELFLSLLAEYYDLDHEVILYEAPTLPIHSPRIEHIPLSGLIQSEINQQTTLIIPPIEKMKPNKLMYEKLALLAKGNTDLRIV